MGSTVSELSGIVEHLARVREFLGMGKKTPFVAGSRNIASQAVFTCRSYGTIPEALMPTADWNNENYWVIVPWNSS